LSTLKYNNYKIKILFVIIEHKILKNFLITIKIEFKMCTEFFLACLYFVIIFLINFFLYKLLYFYLKNIFELQKIKKILTFYPDSELFTKLYKYSNKELRNLNSLSVLNKINVNEIDTLTIGNIYKYLAEINRKNLRNNSSDDYYFQLLSNQYLSFMFRLK